MSEIDRSENSIDFRINKTNWIVDVNNSSSITSKDKLPIPATTANIIFKGKPFLFRPSYFEQKFQDGIKVVDRKLGSLQWQEPNSTTSTDDKQMTPGRDGEHHAMEFQQGVYGQFKS